MVQVRCATCGKKFLKRTCWAKRTKEHFCNRRCSGIARGKQWATYAHLGRAAWTPEAEKSYRAKMSGEKNPAWKGGVTFKRDKGNYVGPKYVRCPVELTAMARSDGYVMEHRLVMARKLGRPLLRTEVVHHKDHNTRNNSLSNLELFSDNGTHKRMEAVAKRAVE